MRCIRLGCEHRQYENGHRKRHRQNDRIHSPSCGGCKRLLGKGSRCRADCHVSMYASQSNEASGKRRGSLSNPMTSDPASIGRVDVVAEACRDCPTRPGRQSSREVQRQNLAPAKHMLLGRGHTRQVSPRQKTWRTPRWARSSRTTRNASRFAWMSLRIANMGCWDV